MNLEKEPQIINIGKSEQDQINEIVNNLGLEKLKDSEQRSEIEVIADSIIGCLEGQNALRDFENNRKFIDNREAQFIMAVHDLGFNMTEQNYFLMQIHDRTVDRAQHGIMPSSQIIPENFRDLRGSIKANFIMNFNEIVTNHIEKSTYSYINERGRKIKTECTLKQLQKLMGDELAQASPFYRKIGRKLQCINLDYNSLNGQAEIKKTIEGMRHEAGFKEIIYEIDDGTITTRESSKEQDLKGCDLFIEAKVKKDVNNNKYIYASKDDINKGNFIEVELPIDIKSDRSDASSALSKYIDNSKEHNEKVNHWVLWSHLYPDDFKLGIEYDGTVSVGGKIDKESVYLNYSKHIAAMRDLSNIKYYDSHYQEQFTPESLYQRLSDIKKEILRGINGVIPPEAAVA